MNKINDGGSAFPSEQHETCDGTWNQTFDPGMSLRDYFAGQALVGIISGWAGGDCTPYGHALDAYDFADAMLRARETNRE